MRVGALFLVSRRIESATIAPFPETERPLRSTWAHPAGSARKWPTGSSGTTGTRAAVVIASERGAVKISPAQTVGESKRCAGQFN